MEGRLLLKDCAVFRADGRVRPRMAVLIEDDRITRVAPDAEVPVLPGDWEVRCGGRLVMPGLIDCHTHLVNGQLMPVCGEMMLRSPRSRLEVQRAVDAQLTVAEVEALTAYAVARALRSGVTLAFEHLRAPGCVGDALEVQARTAERLGLRMVNSHASDSLEGPSAGMSQFEANANHVVARRSHPLVRGALGFNGSSLCDDELLRALGRAREERGVGAHFHLSEHEEDLATTWARHGRRIVPRLEAFGLLGPGSVGAYARAVDRAEAERLARHRVMVALSPRIDQLSGSAGSGFQAVLAFQNLVGLGTGGTGTLWEELAFAFSQVLSLARLGRLIDPDGLCAQMLMGGPAEACSMLFGAPSGTVEEGSLADLVVYDHVSASEAEGGLAPCLLLQLGRAPVAWTIVGGRVTVREGQLIGATYAELAGDAARALEGIWRRSGIRPPPGRYPNAV